MHESMLSSDCWSLLSAENILCSVKNFSTSWRESLSQKLRVARTMAPPLVMLRLLSTLFHRFFSHFQPSSLVAALESTAAIRYTPPRLDASGPTPASSQPTTTWGSRNSARPDIRV